jgi:hypothetical protein
MGKSQDRKSLLQKIRDWLRNKRREPQNPPDLSEPLVPVRRGPSGRSGAAVAEPEEDSDQFYPPRRA